MAKRPGNFDKEKSAGSHQEVYLCQISGYLEYGENLFSDTFASTDSQ
jgi:hypothetical protein